MRGQKVQTFEETFTNCGAARMNDMFQLLDVNISFITFSNEVSSCAGAQTSMLKISFDVAEMEMKICL